jgi:predicted alpha/beta hydrolase family esterase
MRNACIFHGTDCSPESYWIPYVKKGLENLGFELWVPLLPEAATPKLPIQLPFVLDNYDYNAETVLIGHSAGCPLALSVLENLDIRINKTILVSGFVDDIGGDAKNIIQDNYNWKKIKNNCDKFFFLNSDNDPWGCNDKQGKKMQENLGGKYILMKGQGHMGSDTFNQPYKEFPLIIDLVKGLDIR